MPTPTQRDVSRAYVVDAAAIAFGDDAEVVLAEPLTGGSFAGVWRVDFADGRSAALKIGANPAAAMLTYERDLLAAEATYLQLVADRARAVPTPRLLHQTPDWIFMTLLPGVALPDLPAEIDTTVVRQECGEVFARLHAITGDFFGYTGDRPREANWPAAYRSMIEALLDDAVTFDVALPVQPSLIRSAVEAQDAALATVGTPVLLHFDLWDGNVLATVREGVAHLAGLVDGERYFYGDPLVDFCSPALMADIFDPPGHPFLAGYRRVRPFEIDGTARRRLWLCQLYLYLIMMVEFPSRGLTPASRPEHWGRLSAIVTDLVDRLTATR